MSAIGSNAALQAGVEAVNAEAAGAIEIVVIMQSELDGLLLDALAGSREAQHLLPPVLQALGGIAAAPANASHLCACCPRPVRQGGRFNLAVALPARADASRALGLAVCGRCATEPAAVLTKAIQGFRKIWPSLRTASVTHPEGGRA